jgi:hypothetical protein
MTVKISKAIVLSLSMGLVAQLVGCGTILHPERKGQISGQIDPKIAVFDAIGLLFFFLPGIIAFAVDFNNGTIYLPGGRHASLSPDELQRISPNGKLDQQALSALIHEKGLISANVNLETMSAKPIASMAEVETQLSYYSVSYASNF